MAQDNYGTTLKENKTKKDSLDSAHSAHMTLLKESRELSQGIITLSSEGREIQNGVNVSL